MESDRTPQTDKFTERDLAYDRNGNILSLKRYGATTANPQEDLAYTYNGNKLTQLNNSGTITGSYTYTYDNNGNTLTDSRRGLSFTWNHLNLPASITSNTSGASSTIVDYTYLADGTKAITSSGNEGYAYLGTMTYKLSGGTWSLESVPFTGGRFIANASGGFGEYRYITDHLGSTRVIVTGEDYHEVEHNDYYPFGMRIADNTLLINAVNRWRFSGKEIQTLGNIGLVDFGARLYDEDAVKWKSQDPMADSYSWLSPYGYCAGNPITLIDPFGTSPIYSPDGSFLGTDDQGLQGDFIIMDKSLFEQGMAHDEAMTNQWKETISESIMSAIQAHFASLPERPDYDGFVTIAEGIDWAKQHEGALMNPTPDNTLYIDVSKINFGRLSALRFLFNREPYVNLYWRTNLNFASINSSYALGTTRIIVLDRIRGTVKLSSDKYDWDYHNKRVTVNMLGYQFCVPIGGRDTLIYFERKRANLNDSHGFPLSFYGVGKIHSIL